MLALLFEVEPELGHDSHYFDRAAALRPSLENHAGLLFLDRYRCLQRRNVILSHSLWRDEEAITALRTDSRHRTAQAAGHDVHHADYRIRIAEVRQIWPDEGQEPAIAPSDTLARTGSSESAQVIVAVTREQVAPDLGETFFSLNNPSTRLTLGDIFTGMQGQELLSHARTDRVITDLKLCSVIRGYGTFDRDRAPTSEVTDAAV